MVAGKPKPVQFAYVGVAEIEPAVVTFPVIVASYLASGHFTIPAVVLNSSVNPGSAVPVRTDEAPEDVSVSAEADTAITALIENIATSASPRILMFRILDYSFHWDCHCHCGLAPLQSLKWRSDQ